MSLTRRDQDGAESPEGATTTTGAPGRSSAYHYVARKQSDEGRKQEHAVLDAAWAGTGGAPLPGDVRAPFEASLGADLGDVRVHTGAESAQSAKEMNAQAYTVGQDIHFGAGKYDPGSGDGQWLLAHEVAHTVQQRDAAPGPQAKLEVSEAGEPAELEADRAADAMVSGGKAKVSPASGAQRKVMRFDAGSGGHQGIEREVGLGEKERDTGLGKPKNLSKPDPTAGSKEAGVNAVYAGNFMQDFSQMNSPMFLDILSKMPKRPAGDKGATRAQLQEKSVGAGGAESITSALIRALAILEVGPRLADSVVAGNMQQYRPEQHVDQPVGYSPKVDAVVRSEKTAPPGTKFHELRPGKRTTEGYDKDRDEQLAGSAVPGLQMENPELFKVSDAGLQNHIYNNAEWVKKHWLKAARTGATDEGRFHVGAGLHAIEDYFSHSNFVEVALNGYIDWATARSKKKGQTPAGVGVFLDKVAANEQDKKGVHSQQKLGGKATHVDTLYDKTGGPKGKRQAITTGSVGSNDMKVSIGHILLPQVPTLEKSINEFIDKAFKLVKDDKVSSWAGLKKTLGEERPMAAVLALGDGIDGAGVTLPVPTGVSLIYGRYIPMPVVDNIDIPTDFKLDWAQVPFTRGIDAYVGFVQEIKSTIDTVQSVMKYAKYAIGGLGFVIAELVDRLRKEIDEKLQALRDEMKVQLNQLLIRMIDTISGVNPQDQKNRTVGDALHVAHEAVEELEHQTSLEGRLLHDDPDELGGLTQAEAEAVVGPVKRGPGGKGWVALEPLPPSHSEISKDHAPHADMASHAKGTPVRDAAKKVGGGSLEKDPLHPGEPAGADHDVEEGSIFYGLGRSLALEADRHVMAQVERMWAEDVSHHPHTGMRQGSLYGDGSKLDQSKMIVDDASMVTEAGKRGDEERDRSKAAGHVHAQEMADNASTMRRPEVKKLMDLVDLIMSHPEDSTWWKGVFDSYISGNADLVATHIQQRNSVRRNRTKL